MRMSNITRSTRQCLRHTWYLFRAKIPNIPRLPCCDGRECRYKSDNRHYPAYHCCTGCSLLVEQGVLWCVVGHHGLELNSIINILPRNTVLSPQHIPGAHCRLHNGLYTCRTTHREPKATHRHGTNSPQPAGIATPDLTTASPRHPHSYPNPCAPAALCAGTAGVDYVRTWWFEGPTLVQRSKLEPH